MRERITVVSMSVCLSLSVLSTSDFEDNGVFSFEAGINVKLKSIKCGTFLKNSPIWEKKMSKLRPFNFHYTRHRPFCLYMGSDCMARTCSVLLLHVILGASLSSLARRLLSIA